MIPTIRAPAAKWRVRFPSGSRDALLVFLGWCVTIAWAAGRVATLEAISAMLYWAGLGSERVK